MDAKEFKEKDVHWKNKHEFLSLPLDKLDRFNVNAKRKKSVDEGELKGRQFT